MPAPARLLVAIAMLASVASCGSPPRSPEPADPGSLDVVLSRSTMFVAADGEDVRVLEGRCRVSAVGSDGLRLTPVRGPSTVVPATERHGHVTE